MTSEEKKERRRLKQIEYSKKWKEAHKEKVSKYKKIYDIKYYQENKEKILKRKKEYYENNQEIIKEKVNKNYDKEKRKNYRKIYYENNKNNIGFKIKKNLRTRLFLAVTKKQGRTMDFLGCSIEELIKHLESKFQEGMSWDNYGIHGWHVDHIRPCASFNLLNEEEQRQCFHYTNLQPLWAEENLKKRDRLM